MGKYVDKIVKKHTKDKRTNVSKCNPNYSSTDEGTYTKDPQFPGNKVSQTCSINKH